MSCLLNENVAIIVFTISCMIKRGWDGVKGKQREGKRKGKKDGEAGTGLEREDKHQTVFYPKVHSHRHRTTKF